MNKPVNSPDAAKIYAQHDAAFAQVSAFVIIDRGDGFRAPSKVATVAFKFPPHGHGERRVYAYVHWLGLPMVRGWASGCGYDKKTAACASAVSQIGMTQWRKLMVEKPEAVRLYAALQLDTGPTWQSQLESAGFIVLQAV